MPLISVIVPIYNVEEYLNRCLNSIINQTEKDFELILVDDGSPDKCPQMCDEWAKKDNRIVVVHKENGGLSDARNSGLKIAKGKYIVFIDSDDWIDKQYLKFLLETITSSKSEIVECNIKRCEDDTIQDDMIYQKIDQNGIKKYNAIEAMGKLIREQEFHQYVWNKIYRRDTIGNILFEKGKTNEDEFWTYQVFGNAKTIVHIDESLYYYYQRESSIMGSRYNLKRLHSLEAKELRQQYIDSNYPELSNIAKDNLYQSCMYQGQMSLRYLSDNELNKAKEIIEAITKKISNSEGLFQNKSFKQKVWLKISKVNFWKCCCLRNLLRIGL